MEEWDVPSFAVRSIPYVTAGTGCVLRMALGQECSNKVLHLTGRSLLERHEHDGHANVLVPTQKRYVLTRFTPNTEWALIERAAHI